MQLSSGQKRKLSPSDEGACLGVKMGRKAGAQRSPARLLPWPSLELCRVESGRLNAGRNLGANPDTLWGWKGPFAAGDKAWRASPQLWETAGQRAAGDTLLRDR